MLRQAWVLALVGAVYCRDKYAGLPTGTPWQDCVVTIGGLAIQGAEAFMAAQAPTFQDYLSLELNGTHGLQFEALFRCVSYVFLLRNPVVWTPTMGAIV